MGRRLSQIIGSPVVTYSDPSAPGAGQIVAFAGTTAPTGWAICNGATLAVADYPELYAAIGTTFNTAVNPTTGSAYAAPSAGQFRIPDYRGLYLRGAGTTNLGITSTLGVWQDDATAKNGLANSSVATGFMSANATHSHRPSTTSNGFLTGTGTAAGAGGAAVGGVSGNTINAATTESVNIDHGHSVPAQTITGDTETRPQSQVTNWIIKLYNATFVAQGAGISATGPSLVDTYSTELLNTTITGATTSPAAIIRCVRNGRLVSLTITPSGSLTKNGSAGTLSFAALIPSQYRPTGLLYAHSFSSNPSSVGIALWVIDTGGTIQFTYNSGGSNIPASTAGIGWGASNDISFTYAVR